MGKVRMGILDGFYGKVGTVVGSFWKGKPVMRAYVRPKGTHTSSEAQALVQTRFGAINSLSGAFLSAIRIGLFEVARRKRTTEGNIFVHENWGCVHADTPGAATVDYTELVIAMGHLPEAQFGAAHRVHVWGFAVGAGPDNEGEISNSRYLGSGTIS